MQLVEQESRPKETSTDRILAALNRIHAEGQAANGNGVDRSEGEPSA
jgi:hypothetical protein